MFSLKSILLLSIFAAVSGFPRSINQRHASQISELTLANPHPHATRFFRGLSLLPYSGSHYWRRDVGYAPSILANPVSEAAAFTPGQAIETAVSESVQEPLAIELPTVQELLPSDDVLSGEAPQVGPVNIGDIAADVPALPDVAVANTVSSVNTESRIVTGGSQSGIDKSIYVFLAPDAPAQEPIRINSVGGVKGTHYQIIFIKTPSSPAPEILLPKLDGSSQEKTLIYLLSENPRQPTAPVLNLNSETFVSKPEVFFIKYTSDGVTPVLGNGIQEPRVPSNDELAIVEDVQVAAGGSATPAVEETAPPALDAVKLVGSRLYRSPFHYYSNRRHQLY